MNVCDPESVLSGNVAAGGGTEEFRPEQEPYKLYVSIEAREMEYF